MRICDSFLQKGRCYIACTGSEITKTMSIEKIKVQNTVYKVERFEIAQSIGGQYQAMLELNCNHILQNKEATLVS